MDTSGVVFPALLRFWREATGQSQEDLAGICGVSVRHLSYLENGKAKPSAEMVGRLSGGLNLQMRERSALFQAAGFVETHPSLPSDALERHRADWGLMLRALEPTPSAILSSLGDVCAANRAWLALHAAYLGRLMEGDCRPINALRLLLDPSGWRRFVEGWQELGMAMLSIAQQEALLTREAPAAREIRDLARLAGFDANWPAKGARIAADAAAYGYSLRTLGVPSDDFRVVYASLGAVQPGGLRSAILQTIFPERPAILEALRNVGADFSGHRLLID